VLLIIHLNSMTGTSTYFKMIQHLLISSHYTVVWLYLS